MNNELNFKLNVQPAINDMMENTEAELAKAYGITPDDFRHAIFNWITEKLIGQTPLWMLDEMAQLNARAEADNTIEGEAG